MTTTVMATALPHSLADDAPFQLTVFFTHKLLDGGPQLSDYPAAADWVKTLAEATLTMTTSNDPGTPLALRVVSSADGDAWSAILPPSTRVMPFPNPSLSGQAIRTNPASRMSDHAVDLHVAAMVAAPTQRPGLALDPIASSLLETMANLDQGGPLRALLDDAPIRARRELMVPGRRQRDTLATIGPLTEPGPVYGRDGQLPPLPSYQVEPDVHRSPIEVLLSDPEADLRVTRSLDNLVGQGVDDPQLRLMADAHAMRRYYERPEQPQQEPRTQPDPDAPPTPRPEVPTPDFHARAASFGSTPVLLRLLGLAVDVVLEGMDAAGARAALAGAKWVSVALESPHPDLKVLPSRRTSVVVDGPVFAARSSREWVGGALPLGEDGWVVLDADPDASGLKLDQFARNLARQYASEANGDPATSAPGTLRATGFALARRDRAGQVHARLLAAEALATDDGTRELLLDDIVRGIRVEVWDDVTRQWHSLHRRRVDVTSAPGGGSVLGDVPDVGFLQLSALNRAPDDATNGYYLHEVVAGWDGWSLSAPRPGLVIVHVEPPGRDGATEVVLEAPPDDPLDGAHIVTRVESGSLPRLRYGTSYSFRVLAVDLAGNSVPQVAPPLTPRRILDGSRVAKARQHLDRLRASYAERDLSGVASARREAVLHHLTTSRQPQPTTTLPPEMLSGDARIDRALQALVSAATAADDPRPVAQQSLQRVEEASRILASTSKVLRVRPQLLIDPATLAELLDSPDLLRPRLPRPVVTLPRPYLRWEPVPAPAVVPRQALAAGEQPTALVVRSGVLDAGSATSERHVVPPKATQLEAEAAGLFDAAIGTGDAAEIRRLYAIALAERGTLLDQFVPSLTDAAGTVEQGGIALVDRPGADTGSEHRATLADITAERGRPIGEGQYVIHDTDALRLPYLPDPYATGISLVFWEAGAPHVLPEPRALQAVTISYPGTWPSLQPLRLVLEPGEALDARVVGHEVRVSVPAGEQVRVAVSSTLEAASLQKFGLWRSHLASVADPADGYTTDEVVAAATLMRAASSGWTWWLTPSVDLRLVHAVPTPVRPPAFADLELFLRPPGRSVATFSGIVDVHGASTDTLVVVAHWSEQVDDVNAPGPQQVTKSDVVLRSPVAQQERRGVLFLFDYLPTGPLFEAFRGMGFHRMVQTFEDTHHRRVTYVPSGTTRYAEYFTPSQVPDQPPTGEPVVLDILSSARPAAPVVLDTVPLLRWEERPEPEDPFGWRRIRRSGARIWLARPWFSSGDGELLGVLVFDTMEWVEQDNGTWVRRLKDRQAPDGATSLWAADPLVVHGAGTSAPTSPPLLTLDQLMLDTIETGASGGLGITPPLHGAVVGGRDRGWPHTPGNPVDVADAVPLRDVQGQPEVRVLGYQPEYDEASKRWFVDVALQETAALWPFVRFAVARYQPNSIQGCSLSPVALAGWVQPLPTRTLTVTRPDAHRVQVTLTGVVNWLRFDREATADLSGGELGPDTPTGDDAVRAARLQRSRTVLASVQRRPEGAGNLDWETVSSSVLLAVHVEEDGDSVATWTGSVVLPSNAGTPDGDAAGVPGLRRPGGRESSWRVLVEEHELLDTDPTAPGFLGFVPVAPPVVPRLVHADEVAL